MNNPATNSGDPAPVAIPGPNPAVIFDMDDTLIYCGRHYEEARKGLYDLLVAVTPSKAMPSYEEFYKLHVLFDASRLATSTIPVQDRFPTSLGKFYELWCKEHGIKCDPSVVKQAVRRGYDIYDTVFESMPGACQMLDDLARTHSLYLYTCGSEEIQIRRVLQAGFDHYFKGVGIPDRKTARPLSRFMIANGLNTRDTWIVGNSRSSDIAPALEVGIPPEHCVLITSYSWSADDAEIAEGVHIMQDLAQVAPIIQKVEVLA